ncbi:hypothetical protein B5M42_022000 [Paenibacillus athensensis]|uniref:5-bromo-4-chloroindolyl phosphate hydrolysis protein n=1 Tax=Paenibacillus athensensis TaxID=1967502 RepID=A0A4Y8PXN1_9BACL|nr:hypothetical protein [Paenibacillus athensensis]MCD1261479.1 hypothetical protein [Paenibacillus athensensis]
MQFKPLAGAAIGTAVAAAAGVWLPHMPLLAGLLLPLAGCAFGSLQPRRAGAAPLPGDFVADANPASAEGRAPRLAGRGADTARQPERAASGQAGAASRPATGPADGALPSASARSGSGGSGLPLPERRGAASGSAALTGAGAGGGTPAPIASASEQLFQPVKEYLEVLEDMVISEGQSNNLDDEIVEKSLALFSRIHRVLPQLAELRDDEINHRVRRLVLRDLNSFITPFLRLSGEAKTRNRRTLLNGLKDIQADVGGIVASIERKDLLELQARADLIHQRYSSAD